MRPFRRMTWLRATPVLLAVAMASISAAQQDPVDSSVQEEVRVVLMEIPVVARDSNDRPVDDLTREDLLVRIGGKTVDIKHLDSILQDQAEEDLPEVKLYVKIGAEYEAATTEAVPPQYYIFFIDVENNDLLARDRAQEQIKSFIENRTTEYDRIGVVSYDGTLNLEQSFTTDRDGLLRAVDRAFARSGRPVGRLANRVARLIADAEECEDLTNNDTLPGAGDVALAAAGTRLVDDDCVIAAANEYRMENKPRVESYLDALEGTVNLTAGVNDRVTVFAYTHGVSVDETMEITEAFSAIWGLQVNDILAQLMTDGTGLQRMEQVLNQATRERVAFHFLDTALAPSDAVASRHRGILQAWTRPLEVAFESPQAHSGAFAEATGGSLWIETEVSDALEKAMEFEGGRYWLGVYLNPSQRKKPPKIKIKSRRDGVKVTYGRGRVQQKDDSPAVRATVVTGETIAAAEEGKHVLPFKLGFPSQDLDYLADEEMMKVNLSLHLVLHDDQGRYLASSYHMLEHSYESTGGAAGGDAVLVLRGGLEAPPGRYQLVALVQNTLTGKQGSVMQELNVGVPEEPTW